jgi:hypothetical protein
MALVLGSGGDNVALLVGPLFRLQLVLHVGSTTRTQQCPCAPLVALPGLVWIWSVVLAY